ncbi:hypothetical protein ACFYKX_07920 [Cytobacillus sp. FJAT-54145]|uniref:Uncharacterized protein n=1 Tax=Cytobacillus spartinae TaxID=3299023 RepID=A0ABW6KBD5_9BACI
MTFFGGNDIDNMAEFLNRILTLGDKIEVLSGDDDIDEGSFVYASGNVLVWVDDDGDLNTTNLDNITVRKI